MKSIRDFIEDLNASVDPASDESNTRRKRLLGLLELALRSGEIRDALTIRDHMPPLPAVERDDYIKYPLFVCLVSRVYELETSPPQLPAFSEDGRVGFAYAFAFVRRLMSDPVHQAWVSFLLTGRFGSIKAADIRAYVRVGRLLSPKEDTALRAVVTAALEFIEAMSDLAAVVEHEQDMALWYLLFLPELDAFLTDTVNSTGSRQANWLEALSTSLVVRRRFEPTLPYDEWMMYRGERIRHLWLFARQMIGD